MIGDGGEGLRANAPPPICDIGGVADVVLPRSRCTEAAVPSLSEAAGLGHRITFGHPLRLGTAKAIGSWPA